MTETQLEQDVAEILIEEEALRERVAELGTEISADYTGRDLLLIGVLKGAVFFMADLMAAHAVSIITNRDEQDHKVTVIEGIPRQITC